MTDDEKLKDLLLRVKVLFEKLQGRIIQLEAMSQGLSIPESVTEAYGDALLAMTNLLDGHAQPVAVKKGIGRRKSRYGSFPALRMILELQGRSAQACANYDYCIRANKDVIKRLTRKRSGGLAHTQLDSSAVTRKEVESLRDDLLHTFSDIWYEVYGDFPVLQALRSTPAGPVLQADNVAGHIHKIELGPKQRSTEITIEVPAIMRGGRGRKR
ncbi:MAG: hypothetical protein OXU42_13000 [Deltaproteobacteria bacterium]|nr:hypothetical protein [Deltaproteobacteria bacterium]